MFKLVNPLNTSRLTDTLFVIRSFFSNVYVIKDQLSCFLIDAGYGERSMEKGFSKLGLDVNSVDSVFLTHSDFDHRGGVNLFSKAEICLGKDEVQMIDGTTPRFLGCIHNRNIQGKLRLLSNDETINIGSHTVRAIATPGHTPGHTAFLVDDHHLFTGDSVGFRNNDMKPLVPIFNKDQDAALLSRDRISRLNSVKSIFTAHFGVYNL